MSDQLRILIIGGYGEFGGRLAELLLRDGHSVIVAGRRLSKAEQFCDQHGGEPLELDINTDLQVVATLGVHVVVDAAGPFQSYGANHDKYHVALAALNCGAHYLDLCDDGNFTQGIAALDSAAKKQNRFALSGASSTPALSAAAVNSVQAQFSSMIKIETSILPGSRAPQGYSVMQAILVQVGNPVTFWRNNAWTECRGWSEPSLKSVDTKVTRQANLITAADVVLFPEHFKVQSVLFRAGLALPVMHKSLQWLGALRQLGWLPELTTFIKPLRWLANRITPFGSDHGGMLVEVIGEQVGALVSNKTERSISTSKPDLLHCSWHLKAEPGYGPYVPTIAVRALIRNIDSLTPGARPCIEELPLEQYVEAMQDIPVTTNFTEHAFNYLFQITLGESWLALPTPLRESHKVVDRITLSGNAKVSRGTSPLTSLVAWVFRFPAACESISVQVVKTRIGDSEIWERNFDGQIFRSTLTYIHRESNNQTSSNHQHPVIQEQFGLMKFLLELPVVDGAMHMNVLSGSCLGIPIPGWLLPVSNTFEYVLDEHMHFCVELLGPLKTGLIVRYEGSLK